MAEKIFIIGGGPGGYVTAIKAAQAGMDVTIAEKAAFGGTCLNRGCIPTKSLLHVTSFLTQNYSRMGISFDKMTYDLDKFRKWKDSSVRKAVLGVEMLLKKNGIKILREKAHVVSSGKVETETGVHEADRIVIASGSNVIIPGFIKDRDDVWTSDNALELSEIPTRLLIIGAGVIGVEIATIYSRLGSEVHLFDMLEKPGGADIDTEIANELEKSLKAMRIKLHLGKAIKAIKGNTIIVEGEEISGDRIMAAIGRCANIKVKHSEIEINTNTKKIRTNKEYETTLSHVYAIGDVIDGPMLAHKASHDGVRLIDLLNGRAASSGEMTSVFYTSPEIASSGMTESQARDSFEDIQISVFPVSANPRANCTKELRGMVKLICTEKKLIGAHIMSEHASEMIWAFSYFIKNGTDIDDIKETVFPHPTFSESIGEAMLGLEGPMLHL
ncbi:dihydrolipoyl dehydrogenase [bacterium]|nr:dihydrolipoyl dehydrogenase [bacterium]